jgi:hypothetical protein
MVVSVLLCLGAAIVGFDRSFALKKRASAQRAGGIRPASENS